MNKITITHEAKAFYRLIEEKLKTHKIQTYKYSDVEYREAAVLIPVFFKDGEAHLLFTRRTDTVEHHKGQISFPGGMVDAGDKDLKQTALRETWEEMGIVPKDIVLLGETDRFLTITNFMITPFVGYFNYPYDYTVNSAEIDKVIETPLKDLLNPSNFQVRKWERNGNMWDVHFYQYNGETIWGVTGFLLSNFLSIVFGTNHFTAKSI